MLLAPWAMAWADNPAQGPYVPPDQTYLPAARPDTPGSGFLNIGALPIDGLPAFTPPSPTENDLAALQGCGGVGQDDYTATLFNDKKVFENFSQRDVNSKLARDLLTYNYSLPQTAALFEQLYTYGNQRYQQFQKACNLTALQQDARQQYINQCIPAVVATLTNDDVTVQTGGQTAGAPTVESLKAARAYDICLQQYNEKSREVLKQTSQSFAQAQAEAADVNKLVRKYMCPETLAGQQGGTGGTCWPNLLVPQVRLCTTENWSSACTEKGYGVTEAPLRLNTLHDALRTAVADGLVRKTVNPFRQNLITAQVTNAMLELAATGSIARLGTTASSSIDPIVKSFVAGIMCQQTDINAPLDALSKEVQGMLSRDRNRDKQASGNDMADVTALAITPFTLADYASVASKIQFPASPLIDTDKAGLGPLLEVAAGCAANQQVPFLDPQLFMNVVNTCNEDSQRAYLAMSAFDVATAATRNIYEYVEGRLKFTLGQLESADISVPLVTQAADANSGAAAQPGAQPAAPLPQSVELRRRAAVVVGTVMLPAVQQQLKRLETLAASRGEFARRLEGLFKTKDGCL